MCQEEQVAGGGGGRGLCDELRVAEASPGWLWGEQYLSGIAMPLRGILRSLHVFLRSKARAARAAAESAELDRHLCFRSPLCPFRSSG